MHLVVAAAILVAAALFSGSVTADEPVGSSVRYNREIVRILQRKCANCHSDPGLAMPLTSYQDVRAWGRAIREEVLERRMPPSPAANGVRPLANDPSLTTREIAIITAWVDGAMPRGDAADLPAPTPSAPWPAGEPDVKLRLPPQKVATDDRPSVRRVAVPVGNASEAWLRGFDIAAGDKRVLRSVFVSVTGSNGENHWIGGWTPWHATTAAPPNTGHRLPRRATLNVELHYKGWTDPATEVSDLTTVGLYLQDAPPSTPLRNVTVTAAPAKSDASQRRVAGELAIQDAITVWALRPRLEDAGGIAAGSVEVKAVRPDGGVDPILWVKDSTPDWQMPFVLREPLVLARGSRLVLVAYGADGTKALKSSVTVLAYAAAHTTGVNTGMPR